MQRARVFCWPFYFAIITRSSIVVARHGLPTETRIIPKIIKDSFICPKTIFGDNSVTTDTLKQQFSFMTILGIFTESRKTYLSVLQTVLKFPFSIQQKKNYEIFVHKSFNYLDKKLIKNLTNYQVNTAFILLSDHLLRFATTIHSL